MQVPSHRELHIRRRMQGVLDKGRWQALTG